MKQLNFLSKSGGQSMGLRVTTLASTVGSPSAHRRATMLRLISVLVLVLTIGVGNVWGADPTEDIVLSSGSFSTDHITWSGTSCTIQQLKGTSSTAVNSSYISAPRVYKGHVLSFVAKTGYKIKSISIKVDGTYYGNSMTAGTTISSNTVTNNTTDVSRTWTSTSGGTHVVGSVNAAGLDAIYIQNVASTNVQLRFTKITITYVSSTPSYTITASSNNNSWGTVSVSGTTITATPADCYQVASGTSGYNKVSGTGTITHTGNSNTISVTPTSNCSIQVIFEKKIVNTYIDEIQDNGEFEDCSASAPSLTDKSAATTGTCAQQHYHFVGWVTTANKANPTSENIIEAGDDIAVNGTTYYAVWAKGSSGGTQEVNDALNRATTGVTGTEYSSWSNKKASSDAIYAGNSAGGNSSIQLRSNNSNSGVVTTSSGGKAKKVTVVWNSNTASGRTLDIYGKNSAYSAASDLYGDNKGTKLGSIVYGTSTELTITGDYEYIGMRSNSGAMYLTSVTIKWEAAGGTTYSNYATSCCQPLGSINGSVSVTNQTVSWSAVTDASGYKVKVDNGDWTDIGNVLSYTPTLACGSGNHNVYVKAYNNNNPGHCTGDGPASNAIQVTSAACTEPEITASPTSLSNLNYIVGQGASATQSFSINGTNLTSGTLTVTAPANFEVSKASGSGWASSITFTGVSGTLAATTVYVRLASGKSAGEYSGNVAITGCGLASAVNVGVSGSVLQPTLSASPNSIAFGEVASTSSASHNVTVTMTNITGNVTASLTGTDAAKFSIDKNSLSSSGTITVSKNSTAVGGPYSATLSLSATGVSTVEIPISMTLIEIPTYTLKALNLIEEGDEVIIVGNNGDSYAMSNNNGTSSAPAAVAVTITNDAITNPANTIIWEVSPSNSGYTFYPKGSTTTWLYCTNTNNGVRVGSNDNKLFTLTDGYLKNTGTSRYVGIYISQDWRCYTSTGVNIEGQTFSFYVKESTTPKVSISGTMNAFTYMRDNGPSAAQTFSVRGNKLTADLVVNAPENYEVCTTEDGTYTASINLTPENKTVSETTLYIRLKSGLAINSYNGNITVSSIGATNATKAVTGSVTTPIYTVTLNTNGGTIADGHDVTSYTEGVGATLPTAEYISKSGFSFEGWFDNEDLEGDAVTTIATNATGAKTYWAKWTELPGYDITWLVDGEAYTVGTPSIRVTSGGSIEILPSTPTSLDITSKTFVGWTTAPVNEKQANAPTPLYTAANQIPGNITENKIFYAVFAQETHSGTFTKVTDASTLAAGDRLLFVYESGNKAAGALNSGYLTSQSITISNNIVTNKQNALVYVLGGSAGAWTLTSSEGTLGCTGTTNTSLSASDGTGTWTIGISSGDASIANTGYTTRCIRYNTSSPRFSSYTSSTQNTTPPQLYREGTSLNNYTTKFVKPVAVTGVTLNKDATTLAIDATETLTAIIAPANATNKNVSWTTSDGSIATVEAGVVTAVAAGEATITVTTEDGSFTDECVVTVLPTVETPTFSPAAGAINKSSKVEISCGTADATILYSIDGSDPSVAYPEGGVTINANCTLKAKATKANYTTSAVAEAAYTIIKASQTVSFTESAVSFRLNSTEYNAFTGQTASSTYGSAVITYASSNTSVAEVDENTGAVTLKGVKGTTTITATAAEDEDYQSDSETYTITVLRAGKTRTGDFMLVTDASQLADGDYILLTSETRNGYSDPDYAYVFNGISGSQGNAQTKNVVNDEITYAQLLAEGNTAKIIYLEKVTVGNIDYWAFNYGTDDDIYIAAGISTGSGAAALRGLEEIDDYCKWTISIGEGNVANVNNKGNTTYCALSYNTQGSGSFKAYKNLQTGSLRIYKQKDKNKTPQTLSFVTPSYEFPLNESAYTSFAHQTVSGAQTAVTYTSNNDAVAVINNNTVVLNGGVGTATITATAAEDDDYEHASATYTITVTAALNTVTFHYYKAADATADQTALKEASSGAGITVPANPANVGEYTFIGWAPATLAETQTAPNNLVAALQAGAIRHPNTNEDYYAIYRRLENSDGRFYLMHNNNYAKAPASSTSTNFQNTTTIGEAAVFEITEDNKLFYYEGNTPRYFSSLSTETGSAGRVLIFYDNAAEAAAWTIVESGLTTTFFSETSSKYLMHNNTMWAAYATANNDMSEILTQVYLADVYYSSTPNLMVSPVLTWAHGNATHVMEIEATYDNAATATVGGEPVSVSYSSSDPEKATVSNAGVVTAIKGGLVTITATVAENPGVSRQLVETYQVSITKKVPQIVFNDGANWVVYVGEAYKRVLADNVEVTTDGAITYTLSSNATSSDYASINTTTGEVTGLYSNGSAIQAFWVHTEETDMYQAGAANHQFQVWSLKPQTLTFDQAAYAFEMNESVAAFTNTLSGAQTTVTYISNNTDVAEIDSESGEVTVHTNVCGTATITATAAEGQAGELIYREVSQTYTITVNYPMPTFSMESNNIKAPVSLTISGYDENTKLYWTDGNEDPATLYSEPLAISDTKTIRAKATNADVSLVSPIASVTLTKVTPTVVGSQEGGTITLNADEGSLITYIIENGNGVTVASGEDIPTPVVFETEMSDTYTVLASAKWNVENGFVGEEYLEEFVVKGKGHLPIHYEGNGSGLDNEAWATKVGAIGNYNSGDLLIKFDASEQALIASFVEKPVQLSYDIKHNPKDNSKLWNVVNNEFKVQWSADGETYHDIVVYTNSNTITKDVMSPEFDLDPSARYIKWIYVTKDTDGGNVALGNIRITCEAVVIDGVSVVDIPEGYDGDVVVENGVTWEPEENEITQIHNLLIKQDAIVDATDVTGLIVNDVILESMEGHSGQILEPDNFLAEGNAYYDLTLNTSGTMDNSKWYAFAVPFQVDAASGIQRLSNDGKTSNAGFNSHYRIKKYDSAQRLSTGKGWVDVTSGETLYPGHFYMISLNSNVYNRLRMTKKAGAPVNNKADLTLATIGTGPHANWNALANNALAYANVSATGTNAGLKVQVYNSATDNYTPYEFVDITLTVGTPFFFQAAETGTMSIVTGESNHETLKAPARNTATTEEFKLRLGADTESFYDQLYVSASDEALNEYQIGHDLAKAGVSTTVPQMYIPAYGVKLCDAEFPLVNNEATFPLTFTIPTAGTYQLYLADAPENANLYLQKNGVTVWDMTAGAYALEIESGTNTEFSLLLKIKENTMTGVDQINAEAGVQKVVINEHVYILRGGEMYDMTGKMVK